MVSKLKARNYLVYLRKKAGYSNQESFASKINVGVRTYHSYENSPEKISFVLFRKIVKVLDLERVEEIDLYDTIMKEETEVSEYV